MKHHNSHVIPVLALGFAAGAAAGLIGSGMAGERGRRKIKRQAEHAMHTMGQLARDLTSSLK